MLVFMLYNVMYMWKHCAVVFASQISFSYQSYIASPLKLSVTEYAFCIHGHYSWPITPHPSGHTYDCVVYTCTFMTWVEIAGVQLCGLL